MRFSLVFFESKNEGARSRIYDPTPGSFTFRYAVLSSFYKSILNYSISPSGIHIKLLCRSFFRCLRPTRRILQDIWISYRI